MTYSLYKCSSCILAIYNENIQIWQRANVTFQVNLMTEFFTEVLLDNGVTGPA